MSECKLDHPHEDVKEKYEQQKVFLPEEMIPAFQAFFEKEHTQDILNQVFHLLKKYDLASDEEKNERTDRLNMILNNL